MAKRTEGLAPKLDGKHAPKQVVAVDSHKPSWVFDQPVLAEFVGREHRASGAAPKRFMRPNDAFMKPGQNDLFTALVNWFTRDRRHKLHWNWAEGPPKKKIRRTIQLAKAAIGRMAREEAQAKGWLDPTRGITWARRVEHYLAADYAQIIQRRVTVERASYKRRRLASSVDPATVILSATEVLSGNIHPHAVVGVLPDGSVECILCVAESSRQARLMAKEARRNMLDDNMKVFIVDNEPAKEPKRIRHRGTYGSRAAMQEGENKTIQIIDSKAMEIGEGLPVPISPMELAEVTALAKTRAHAAIEALTLALADKRTSVAAANALLDRAYGKAPLSVTVSDPSRKKAAEEMTSAGILEILAASGVSAINGKSIEDVRAALAAKEKAPVSGSLGSISRGE